MKKYILTALILFVFVFITPGYAVDWQLSWTATGEAAGDYFGMSVSKAGDVNGDGYDDVIVGGPDARRAYIYYGGALMDNTPDVVMDGEAGNGFGVSVSKAGDVNGDGYDDVIVGDDFNNAGGFKAGRAYIYYGGASMDNTPDVIMTGQAAEDQFGISVSTAGDVNNDGYSDVIVGGNGNDAGGADAGRAYIYYGSASMDDVADVTMTGQAAGDNFGSWVRTAGDVNGDGYCDVIVGGNGNDAGGADAGRAYIYYGGASMDDVADVTMTGEAAGDQFGRSVSTAGDVNNDGYSDVIVGALYNDAGGADAGRAYIYYGGASMDNTPDLTMTGEAAGDNFGSVSTAGDVNGDEYDDVIVGAWYNDAGGANAGRAYIYYGGASVDNTPDVIMTGEAAGDNFGYRGPSTAGDVNGDEYDDVIVGARSNDTGGSNAGKAYIYSPYLFILIDPDGGETWDVGVIETVSWKGKEKADICLSVDGGASYEYKIIENIGGADSNFFSFRVPHTPSRFSRIMVVDAGATPSYPVNYDVSDSFFTIQSTITLLAFTATPGEKGGAQLTWNTDPCVPDIQGYNLYCSNTGTTDFEKLNNEMITENEYSDDVIRGGVITYRLGAVNGWGQEYIVGDAAFTSIEQPLIIYPSMLKDKGTVVFWFSQAFPGETETDITVSIYDVLGKKIKTIINQKLAPGFHTCQFDGKDDKGISLPAGAYFIIMRTPNYTEQAKFIKLK